MNISAQEGHAQCESSPGESCCSDLNDDGVVNQADLALLLPLLGCSGCACPGDFNFDGATNQVDLTMLLTDWSNNCQGPRPVPMMDWGNGGLPLGRNGTSFADFDADGYPDAVTWFKDGSQPHERRLYFNRLGSPPPHWSQGCMLGFSPYTLEEDGYGLSATDYNNDGYPDFANEPRTGDPIPSGDNVLFLVNAGCQPPHPPPCAPATANFVNAAACLGIQTELADEDIETNCWGDIDGDGDVDLFMPAYLLAGQHGNFLYVNTGVQDPACSSVVSACQPGFPRIWGVVELATQANLGTFPGCTPVEPLAGRRPEGEQFVDYDFDGDLDLYYQEVVHQNRTTMPNSPHFATLLKWQSGIVPLGVCPTSDPEEGLLLADLDMDGDLDMLRLIGISAMWLNRNRGDGTFESEIDLPDAQGHGVSAADWDNDGDLDITGSGRWFRNSTVERTASGTPCPHPLGCLFKLARCPDLDLCEVQYGMNSWADVDLDGDLDCARSRYLDTTGVVFYRNLTYNSTCDETRKRYVKVRPVRAITPGGPPLGRDFTENEQGAKTEVFVQNESLGLRRVAFTASSAGYLTQNEYILHFGLPADPFPNDPAEDPRLDVQTDFVEIDDQTPDCDAVWRVDWTVNPALRNINLATLYVNPADPNTFGRPVAVYRDGRVRYAGQLFFLARPEHLPQGCIPWVVVLRCRARLRRSPILSPEV